MPIYEFECSKCHTVFEKICNLSDDVRTTTCDCGYLSKKIMSKSDFYLKGGGWAADGYDTNVEKFKENLKAVDSY